MRVLVVTSALEGGGAETVLRTLTPTWVALGAQCTVANLGPHRPGVEAALRGTGVAVTSVRSRSAVKRADELRQASESHDVIVGFLERGPTYVAAMLKALTGKPAVAVVHTHLGMHDRASSFGTRVYNWLPQRLAYHFVDFTVAVSNGVAEALVSDLGLSPERVTTIHNPVDLQEIRRLSLATSIPIPDDVPYAVVVGRLVRHKRVDRAIRVHKRLLDINIKHRLVIVGDGPCQAQLAELVHELGVQATVQFVGYQVNPYPIIRGASLMLVTSHYEGFALVIVEAMGLGTAVVTVDCQSGPVEITAGGRYGVLVSESDESALVDAAAHVLQQHGHRMEVAAAGLIRAHDFDPLRIGQKYLNLFKSIVHTRPSK